MAIAALGQLNTQDPPQQWWCPSIDSYQRLDMLGEGSYGQVFKATEIGTGKIVAVKKLLIPDSEKEGFPATAIREIKLLTKLRHDNVIALKEIVTDHKSNYMGDTYLVFEYMEHDLAGLSNRCNLRFATRFTVPQIKCYMKQLLAGLSYCHDNHVVHRDIKCANLLIDNEGSLKIADFGLARSLIFGSTSDQGHRQHLTNNVVTLWYRPPELLLGATDYGTPVDMWSAGCIFGKLLTGRAIICGESEASQLKKIFELCGAPDQGNWPGAFELPLYERFRADGRPITRRIREVFRGVDRWAVDLLERMLVLDPSKRISAKDALNERYFWTDPLPCDPKMLPKYESSHEYNNIKNKRKNQQQQWRRCEEAGKRQRLEYQNKHVGQAQPPHRPSNWTNYGDCRRC